jgi:hypothetical protein
VRYLGHENGNLEKNAFVKLIQSMFSNWKSAKYFSRKTFSNFMRYLQFLSPWPIFFIYFQFVRYLGHENGNLEINALSKIESHC